VRILRSRPFVIALFATLLASCATVAATRRIEVVEGSPLVITTASKAAQYDGFEELKLGFGMTSRLAEEFSEHGVFVLTEMNPEFRERLRLLREAAWSSQEPVPSVAAGSGVWEASVRIVGFGLPRTRASFGPVSAARDSLVVEVEVTLRSPDGGSIVGRGRGEAKRSSAAVLFEYDDLGWSPERTSVGTATALAIRKAVGQIYGTVIPVRRK